MKVKLAAIVTGMGLLATGMAFAYWQMQQPYGCVRAVSNGSQVTYSWGCINPQRYRQWSVTASAPSEI